MADYINALGAFGSTTPQTQFIRDTYAAAMVDAATQGYLTPPLDTTLMAIGGG